MTTGRLTCTRKRVRPCVISTPESKQNAKKNDIDGNIAIKICISARIRKKKDRRGRAFTHFGLVWTHQCSYISANAFSVASFLLSHLPCRRQPAVFRSADSVSIPRFYYIVITVTYYYCYYYYRCHNYCTIGGGHKPAIVARIWPDILQCGVLAFDWHAGYTLGYGGRYIRRNIRFLDNYIDRLVLQYIFKSTNLQVFIIYMSIYVCISFS